MPPVSRATCSIATVCLFDRDRLPRPTEELEEAIGGGGSAIARPQTAAGSLIDGDRLTRPTEDLAEAGRRASNLIDGDRLPRMMEELAEAGGRASSATAAGGLGQLV